MSETYDLIVIGSGAEAQTAIARVRHPAMFASRPSCRNTVVRLGLKPVPRVFGCAHSYSVF